jgi:branched-chain amino acid transport system substrate-binding protein
MRVRHRIRQRGFISLLVLAAASTLTSGAVAQEPTPATNTITVGALLSLTGPSSSLGRGSQAALELAARDLSAQLARQGVKTNVQVVVADTQLNPETALQKLQALAQSGIRIFIGPQSSAEVRAMKPYADENGIVLISQGSTASSLSIPGDNVFRLVPDDTFEAAAIATLLRADGIRTLVPVWRTDLGNQDLAHSVLRAVQAGGGTVTSGVRYAPNHQSPASTQDFTAELQAIKSQISQAVAQSNAGSVGVYLAAFDEAAALFAQAGADPILASVRWYGSDGTAQSQVFTSGPAAAFAARVGFPCPIYALDDADAARRKPVAEEIYARTGIPADALALSAYDALCVAGLAAVQAGGTNDVAAFKQAFVQVTSSFQGITGSVALNDAGDRQSGGYDFWAICGTGTLPDLFAWSRVAVYNPLPDGTGTISRLPGCP